MRTVSFRRSDMGSSGTGGSPGDGSWRVGEMRVQTLPESPGPREPPRAAVRGTRGPVNWCRCVRMARPGIREVRMTCHPGRLRFLLALCTCGLVGPWGYQQDDERVSTCDAPRRNPRRSQDLKERTGRAGRKGPGVMSEQGQQFAPKRMPMALASMVPWFLHGLLQCGLSRFDFRHH